MWIKKFTETRCETENSHAEELNCRVEFEKWGRHQSVSTLFTLAPVFSLDDADNNDK